MIHACNLLKILLKTPENFDLLKVQWGMEGIYLAVANNLHFFVISYTVFSSCFKIKVNCKGWVSHVLKIVLKGDNFPVIDLVGDSSNIAASLNVLLQNVFSDKKMVTILILSRA